MLRRSRGRLSQSFHTITKGSQKLIRRHSFLPRQRQFNRYLTEKFRVRNRGYTVALGLPTVREVAVDCVEDPDCDRDETYNNRPRLCIVWEKSATPDRSGSSKGREDDNRNRDAVIFLVINDFGLTVDPTETSTLLAFRSYQLLKLLRPTDLNMLIHHFFSLLSSNLF